MVVDEHDFCDKIYLCLNDSKNYDNFVGDRCCVKVNEMMAKIVCIGVVTMRQLFRMTGVVNE
jgi:hypothetical protein